MAGLDIGLQGNILLNRMVGAHIHLVSTSTYARAGSPSLLAQLEAQLVAEGKRPYIIPVGGSDSVGVWGYLEAISEIMIQQQQMGIGKFNHIVFACGSGGTATGIALGARLAGMGSKVHAVGVCDSPEYFYAHMEEVAAELGIDFAEIGHPRDWCTVSRGQGLGYAKSSPAELKYIYEVSSTTGLPSYNVNEQFIYGAYCLFPMRIGIILDPVYSGKALFHLSQAVNRDDFNDGDSVLFVHTGGMFGLYDKIDQISECMAGAANEPLVSRLKVRLP